MIIEENELGAINLIKNKIYCAKQALNINVIPENEESDKVKQYLQAVIDILGGYTWLEKAWWENIYEKYNIDKSKKIHLNLNNGEIKE